MTLTMDPKKVQRSDAYAHINESWRKLREAFRRKFKKSVSFIAVNEFTKKGMPHKHVLINQYIPQRWLSNKWDSLGGGPIVDIRMIHDLPNMSKYVGKYLTKDILIKAPKGSRRFTTSQDIKLREKGQDIKFSLWDLDIDRILELQNGQVDVEVTNKDGRVINFEVHEPIDLTRFGRPNDRPLLDLENVELPEGFTRKYWELLDHWVNEDKENDKSSDLRPGVEQGTTDRRVLDSSPEKTPGVLFQRKRVNGRPCF